MKRTNKQPKDATTGFAIRLSDETELGIAMLITEDENGAYEPLGPAATIGEARELAQDDMGHRRRDLERGGNPLCPAVYKVWARGLGGDYTVVAEFDASTL
jgi:hypothetical protein